MGKLVHKKLKPKEFKNWYTLLYVYQQIEITKLITKNKRIKKGK
jgi:hypothetical protein